MSLCITHNSTRAGTVDDDFTFLDNSGNSNPITRPSTHPPTPANMSTHLGSAHLDPAGTTVPSPNSGNQIHSMVVTPTNFTLSSYSANSTSEITKIYLRMIPIRSIISSHF